MVRNLLLMFALVFVSQMALAQSSVSGVVTSPDGEVVMFANIRMLKNGNFITGAATDFDGYYEVGGLDPGTYDMEITHLEFSTQKIEGIVLRDGKLEKVDVEMTSGGGIDLDVIVVKSYKIKLVDPDNTTQGTTVTAKDIQNLAVKDIAGVVNSAGVTSQDDGAGGGVNIRGSRGGSTVYIVDGIKTRTTVPTSEISQLQVITGGIGAKYGDVAGGLISITTKGPSSKFSGGFELETSQIFDNYNYNLFSGNVSGPILKNKTTGQSTLGFRLSGQYRYRQDDRPPGLPVFRAKDDVIAELEANPLRDVSGALIPAAQFLGDDDVDELDYRPNEDRTEMDFVGKLDWRISPQIDISVGGVYRKEKDRFTPLYGSSYTGDSYTSGQGSWTTFNSQRNPWDLEDRMKGNFRFRHKLSSEMAEEGEEASSKIFKNASYTIQVGYEAVTDSRYDDTHQDRLFDYGHIGEFNYAWEESFDPLTGLHIDYSKVFTGYDASKSKNPILANYNNSISSDVANDLDFAAKNGEFSGAVGTIWNFHRNVGNIYNYYRKRGQNYLDLNGNFSFDIVPDGRKNGSHKIELGFTFEQREYSGYEIAPRDLWTAASNYANRHIVGLDSSNIIKVNDDGVTIYGAGSLAETEAFKDAQFIRKVRDLLGVSMNDFVNVDGISPDDLSLDLFSARELNDIEDLKLDYYGYDYLGNKQTSSNISFNDFFTATDENGRRTMPVAAFTPNYIAGYIQDKFQYKDLIFRLGVRLDRYDANTKVLKDPYSLYEGVTAKDYFAGSDEKPANISDDAVVYVEGSSVKAFRLEDQWYFADGSEANDGNVVFGGSVVTPAYKDGVVPDIKSKDFNPSVSFKDYEPIWNILPRIAVSFPISENSSFFAHYDILAQRPAQSFARASALDYFYMEERASNLVYNNPNLKSQKTIDYEVGFQQKLSDNSALKISAFYKEVRDLIQRRTYLYVATPIGKYTTYDNQDFGTIKGLTAQYDLRRTGNVRASAAYTIQFANGTGSDADSQSGLTDRGNIRTLSPLSYDERHKVNISVDYRYRSGGKYNGPEILGKQIFANAGANLQFIYVSGRPFTVKKSANPLEGKIIDGTINGARKPNTAWANLKIDKDFTLFSSDARRLTMNVYFRVQNLLNTRNIVKVYEATGSPVDDGYLASFRGKQSLNSLANAAAQASYTSAYNWRMINPTHYSLPRRMYIGVIFGF